MGFCLFCLGFCLLPEYLSGFCLGGAALVSAASFLDSVWVSLSAWVSTWDLLGVYLGLCLASFLVLAWVLPGFFMGFHPDNAWVLPRLYQGLCLASF
jgi:hypothetical protein